MIRRDPVLKVCLDCNHEDLYHKMVLRKTCCVNCGSDRLWGDAKSLPIIKRVFRLARGAKE